jgi:hypothetical protein
LGPNLQKCIGGKKTQQKSKAETALDSHNFHFGSLSTSLYTSTTSFEVTYHPNHHHYHHLPSSSSPLNHNHHLRMFIRSAALLAAIYGHGAFAATISEQSCELAETACSNCVNPLTSSYQPEFVANLYASACCTATECDADGTGCVSKKFCYIYSMVSGSNSQWASNLPSGGLYEETCTTGQLRQGTYAQLAWSLEGQCTTANAVSSFSHMTLLLSF